MRIGAGALMAVLLGGQARAANKLAVIDLELTGDLGGPEFEQEHAQRLKSEDAELRRALMASGKFLVMDNAPAAGILDRLQSERAHLFDCACDIEVGKALGADFTMVVWVYRVSGLILTLTYELHDVASEQIVARKAYEFRGDNDTAWTHAIRYMVRDLPTPPDRH
jgi:hypothetical protein